MELNFNGAQNSAEKLKKRTKILMFRIKNTMKSALILKWRSFVMNVIYREKRFEWNKIQSHLRIFLMIDGRDLWEFCLKWNVWKFYETPPEILREAWWWRLFGNFKFQLEIWPLYFLPYFLANFIQLHPLKDESQRFKIKLQSAYEWMKCIVERTFTCSPLKSVQLLIKNFKWKISENS